MAWIGGKYIEMCIQGQLFQKPPLRVRHRLTVPQFHPHYLPYAGHYRPRVRTADGAVAQMGERRVRNAKVRGSIPLGSTSALNGLTKML